MFGLLVGLQVIIGTTVLLVALSGLLKGRSDAIWGVREEEVEERSLLALFVLVVVLKRALALVPVDLAAEALVQRVVVRQQRVLLVLLRTELVGLGEHFVREVLVVLEVELQCESVWFLGVRL